MNTKKYIFSISIMCLLAIFAYAKTQKTKGSTVTQTKQGNHLDLENFTTHPTGLKHKILKPGTGSKPYAGETVTVDYTGWLLDPSSNKVSTKFDSSVDRGQTFSFPLGLGHVIKGWDHTVADMKIGEKRLVVIPANLGYGARGAGATIPPHATLIFEIDLYDAQ